MASNRRNRELAEVERSRAEALHTPDAQLYTTEANLKRYVNPPNETAFPLEYVFARLGDVRGRTVLDYGCGSGENTISLVRRGAKTIALDISRDMIRLTARRLDLNGFAGTARFIVASAHELPLENESVDALVGVAILHHLDLQVAAREVHRVLKAHGRAIFKEPVRDSKLVTAVRSAIPYRSADVSPFERPLTSQELDTFAAAFRTRSVRAFSLPFVNAIHAVPALRSSVAMAYRLDRAILRSAPALRVYAGIRVLEVTK